MERWSIQILDQTNKDSTVQRTILTKLNKQLTNLCNETGLEKDYSRTKIANYTSTKSNKNVTMKKIKNEVKKEVNYIGKLDKNKLGEYADKITTENVIMTSERVEHIKEHHPELENKEIESITEVLENPDYIFKDRKNKDTVLMVKNINYNNKNYRMVVKLNTNNEMQGKSNSIISFWHISEKKLGQYIRNEKIIYEKLDK